MLKSHPSRRDPEETKDKEETDEEEEEEEVVVRKPTQRGRTLRGAAARLAAELNDEDDDEEDNAKSNKLTATNATSNASNKICNTGGGDCGGIYSMRLNQTKKAGRDINKQMNTKESRWSVIQEEEAKRGICFLFYPF